MKATWRGREIAASDTTRELGGYSYFPREAVCMDMLRLARKTRVEETCPHGVRFYDVVVGTARAKRAAWSYLAPHRSMRRIGGCVAFWDKVKVA